MQHLASDIYNLLYKEEMEELVEDSNQQSNAGVSTKGCVLTKDVIFSSRKANKGKKCNSIITQGREAFSDWNKAMQTTPCSKWL